MLNKKVDNLLSMNSTLLVMLGTILKDRNLIEKFESDMGSEITNEDTFCLWSFFLGKLSSDNKRVYETNTKDDYNNQGKIKINFENHYNKNGKFSTRDKFECIRGTNLYIIHMLKILVEDLNLTKEAEDMIGSYKKTEEMDGYDYFDIFWEYDRVINLYLQTIMEYKKMNKQFESNLEDISNFSKGIKKWDALDKLLREYNVLFVMLKSILQSMDLMSRFEMTIKSIDSISIEKTPNEEVMKLNKKNLEHSTPRGDLIH